MLLASAVATLLPMSSQVVTALFVLALGVALWRPRLAVLGSAAAAAWLATITVDASLAARWPLELDGERALAEVRIESLPATRDGQWVADVRAVTRAPSTLAGRALRLRLSGPLGANSPRAGETWQFVVAPAAPRARLNPGGVDLERQWLLERVHGHARVIDSALNIRLAAASHGLQPLREALRQRVLAQVGDRDAAALLVALAIGDTAAMSREQWRVFAAAGITHLVAISGLHVTLFAWLVAGCVRWAWPRLWLPPPLSRWRRETVALSLGFAAAMCYSLLAGFSIPTQRTVAMLAFVLLARLAGRVTSSWDVLGGAAIAVVLLDPLAALDVGFWLSFGALAALMLPAEARSAARPERTLPVSLLHGGQQLLREQCWIGFALMPLTLWLFDAVSIAGFVVNLVAIPLFSFLLVPLALAGSLLPSFTGPLPAVALDAASGLHALCWPTLRELAALPGATLTVAVPWPWWLLAVTGIAGWLLPVPLRLRAGVPLLLLPLLASASPVPAAGQARLSVLDVGDAGAAVLRTRNHAVLLGTAAGRDMAGQGVARHILPWLRRQRIHRLDAVFAARANFLEAAGIAHVLDAVPVGEAWVGGEWPGAPTPVRVCPRSAVRRFDGVQLEWFSAELALGSRLRAPGACAVRITAGGHSVLWIGAATAIDLAAWSALPQRLRSDVLVGALRPRRDAGAWASAVRPGMLLSSVGRDVQARQALARAYGIDGADVYLPSVVGPVTLELTPARKPVVARALDQWWVPRWRVARQATPVL